MTTRPLAPSETQRLYGGVGDPITILGEPSYDVHAHYAHVKELYDEYPYKTDDQCADHSTAVVKLILHKRKIPKIEICEAIQNVIIDVLTDEGIYLPDPPTAPGNAGPGYISAVLRPQLSREDIFFSGSKQRVEDSVAKFIKIFWAFLEILPRGAYEQKSSAPAFPLLWALPADIPPLQFIHDVFQVFFGDSDTFPEFSDKLYENLLAVSGQTRENTNPHRLTFAAHYDGDALEAATRYFKDTALLELFTVAIPFVIPEETRFSGHWIVAAQGKGKTTLLHTMILDDLQKDASIILIDQKGELINPIRKLKAIKDRLIIVDPNNPIALNPLDIPTQDTSLAVSQLLYVFGSLLQAKITPKQEALFRSVLRTLILTFPDPTLETFRDILTNGMKKYAPYLPALPIDLQDFFNNEWGEYDSTRNELIWRLRLILEKDVMRTMLNAPVTKLNIAEEMDAGKVIIINNSEALLQPEGAEFLGRFFIAQVWSAAIQRSLRGGYKKPVFFYIDEADTVIRNDEKIAAIIDRCRSQNIALILAHQRTEQISDKNVFSALSNCAIKFANVEPDDAKVLAPKLYTTPDFLRLKRGVFAAYVRDLTPNAIAFKVTPVDFSQHPTLSEQETAVLNASLSAAYGAQPFSSAPAARGASAQRDKPAEQVAKDIPPSTPPLRLHSSQSSPDTPESSSTW